ncbi:anthrone oxygenase family protein [Taklimakanibacter lacteus]|uniref:anthrone oxygenase family protein n=1 Tax=Taklimakanibacter lacteus TaxID=2268456 RepID=UPI000E6613F2
MSILMILEIAAAAGAGLTAGIFYAFSTFVMAALARLPAEQGIAAMNSINVTVINPWFMAVFMGTPVLCGIIAILALLRWNEPGSLLVIAAALTYIAGSFVVTMVFNVPLNNALAAAAPASSEGAALWARYLIDWTLWNHVRTALPLVAMVLLVTGLIAQNRPS